MIDADIVCWKIASTNEEKYDWGGVISTEVTDIESVKKQLDSCLKGYLEVTGGTDLVICLTDDNANWRNKVLPSYKQHRKGAYRPVLLNPLKEYLAETYPSYRKPTLEADDSMGILSTHPKLIPGRKIIVSEDKDMKTIPGWLYNPRKDTKPRKVSLLEANLYHMEQTLTGDATDGYKGCPGSGVKAFEKLLVDWPEGDWAELWKRIVEHYESKGFTEYDAMTQARVARICRHTDYNFNQKEVRYWNPPKL